MKRLSLTAVSLICLAAVVVAGQAPSKTPVQPTAAQLDKIKAGIKLHDQGKYDEAIALYDEVLKENPDCIVALYEEASSYSMKKDYSKAIEVATRGTEYQSSDLSSFYMEIGSAFDDMQQPDKAIEAYQRGISISPNAALYYNLAITQGRLHQDAAGIESLKLAAFAGPTHASSQLELGKAFARGGYRSQAVLALSRFLVLEPTSPRSAQVHRMWLDLVRGSVSAAADGKLSIGVNPNAKTDEGVFTQADIVLSLGRAAALAAGAGKPEAQLVVTQLDGWFKLLDDPKVTDRSAFAWHYYVPYFVEIQKQGYTEPFVYWISQRTDLPGVREWVADAANRQRANEFIQWSQKYAWPKQ